MGRLEYAADEEDRDQAARRESNDEDEEPRAPEEGAEENRGSGDEESDDELGMNGRLRLNSVLLWEKWRGEDDNEDDDNDSDDAPEEFTLSQVPATIAGRERVSQQRQQERKPAACECTPHWGVTVAKADRKVRQKRAGLVAKGEEGEGEEEGEARSGGQGGGEEGEAQARAGGTRGEAHAAKGRGGGGRRGGGVAGTAEARGGAREEGTVGGAGAGEEEGEGAVEGGAVEGGAVEGGDFLPADVIAAVTRRQHTRFTEAQEERSRSAVRGEEAASGAGRQQGKDSHTSAVIGTRWVLRHAVGAAACGWVLRHAGGCCGMRVGAAACGGCCGRVAVPWPEWQGAPAPEGEEAARAIMRAAQSFRHGVLFGRRQRSLAALGFVDPTVLKVAGQWRAHKHLVAGGVGGAGVQGGVGARKGGGKRNGRGRGGARRLMGFVDPGRSRWQGSGAPTNTLWRGVWGERAITGVWGARKGGGKKNGRGRGGGQSGLR
ncbi:unnamed protein product [Closterium sp. NIES-65]|nr:unnamed protein product [Closterium sp. NIES-65]